MDSSRKAESRIRYNVLNLEEIKDIHQATLEVLENTGVDVLEDEARRLLQEAGAKVDGRRVRIPARLVEDALETAPGSVTIHRRDGSPGVVLEGRRSYYGTGSDCPYLIDPDTGERRTFRKQDVANAARLCDSLPNIDFFMSMGIAQDVPPAVSDVHQFAAMIQNTAKPIVFTAHDRRGMEVILQIAAAAVGGEDKLRTNPSVCLYAEPVTPLQHIDIAVSKMLLAAEMNIPVIYTPCPMCGATAPATLAGTLVMGNTEVLSGLVIHQLKRPGAPFIGGGVITVMDMTSGNITYGSPEFNLLQAAYADIAHHYELPTFGTAGCSDSKSLDQQAVAEAAISCMTTALCGGNLVHDVGYLEYGLTGCYELVVLMNEIIGMVRRIIRGVEVTPETLAVNVIDAVGPGGHFLGEDHTLSHFRQEIWFPALFDRRNRDAWLSAGGKTLGQKLNEQVREIIRDYQPEPLQEATAQEIARIIRDHEANMGV